MISMVLFISLLVAFLVTKFYRRSRKISALRNGHYLIAAPRWPIIGNLFEFLPEKAVESFMKWKEQYGNFIEIYFFSQRMVMVSDLAIAKEVLMNRPKVFRRIRGMEYSSQKIGIERGLFMAHGPEWSRIRRFTVPSFNRQNIQLHMFGIWELAVQWTRQLEERFADTQTICNFRDETFPYTLDVITKVAFGLKLDYFCSATFVEDTRAFFSFATAHGVYPLPKWTWPYSPQYKYEAAALAASERMTAAAIQLIRQKKLEMQMQQEGTSIAMSGSSTPNSFVETMLRREGSSRLSTEILREDMIGQDEQLELDILGNIKIFYIAGAETTAVTLAFAIHFLTQHLNIFQNLQAEADMFVAKHCHNKNGQDLLKMDFADAHNDQDLLSDLKLCEAIMKETLRLTSPANIMIYERENNNDGTIFILSNGLKIFPKDQVLLYLDGLLTDPEYFQDPLTFDPYRWLKNEPKQMELSDQAFLAFGFGPRACPGMLLAYMEGIFALVNIAHRFHLSLACDPSEIKREVIFTAAPNKVPVYLSKRNRAQ